MINELKSNLHEFYLPLWFDFSAVFFFALTGALAAIKRSYDVIGLFALAFVTGLGGALIRDGIFLQTGPPGMVRDWRYLVAVLAGGFVGWMMGHLVERYRKIIAVLDAIGLGAYSVVGVQRSLASGLGEPAAIFIGVMNACGGGLLRDIIVREEPLMMKPGQFYVLASFLGSVLFVALMKHTVLLPPVSGVIAIGATFAFRMLAIAFNWRTAAVQPWLFAEKEFPGEKKPDEEQEG